MRHIILFTLILSLPLQLIGCGSGGGGGGGHAPTPPTTTTISGKAVKGPIQGADVYAYNMLSDGSAGALLGHTATGADGSYSLTLPAGSGPVIIAVRGNATAKYVNEASATEATFNFTSSEELEALVNVGSTPQTIHVTPLTDMVADLLRTYYGSPTTAPPANLQAAITQATTAVTTVAAKLGVNDITADPGDTAYKNFLILFSQYMIDNKPPSSTQVNAEFAAEKFITAALNDVNTLNANLSTSYNNLPSSIITVNNMTPPENIGAGTIGTAATTGFAVTLSTTGTLPSGSLTGAIDVTLTLPAGISVKASPSPLNTSVMVPDSGVVVLKGAAASASNQILTSTYVQATNKLIIRLINANGLAAGDFATVNCYITSGSTPSTSAFSVSSNVVGTNGVFDLNTAPLSGVQVVYSAIAVTGTVTKTSSAVLTLSTSGTLPSGSLIGAIDVRIDLPVGVSLKATSSQINAAILLPDSGVVVLQGAAATAQSQMLTATYETGTTNKVYIRLINANGLAVGAFVTVNCDVAGGNTPSATSFVVTPNVTGTTGVFDLNTSALSDISVKYSATIQ